MKKEEKEARLRNHEEYWSLVDKIREISLDTLNDEFSVSDMLSALDRVKTELLQQEVIVIMEDAQKQSEAEEEDGSEIEGDVVLPPHTDIKAGSPFVNLSELKEGMEKGVLNN